MGAPTGHNEVVNDSSSPPTLREVAGVAGVAISTVSAYLNHTRTISPELQLRIRDAVRQLDYVPNSQARNLRMRRAASVGLVVPSLENPFFARLAEGIESRLSEEDMTLTLSQSGAVGDREDRHIGLLRKARLDGVIVVSATGRASSSILQLSERFPVVLADEHLPSLDAAFVGSDNRRGGRSIADAALDCGGRRPLVITGPPGLWSAQSRLSGYRESLAAHGFGENEVTIERGDYTFASGLAIAERLFPGDGRGHHDTVIAANDLMALGVLRRLRELGMQVPHDVVVVGFDDIPAAEMLTPSLTTVAQPAYEVGRTAADLILRAMAGEDVHQAHLELPVLLKRRETTVPFDRT